MTAQRYIDTHTHLDDEQFAADIDIVLREASANGVCAMVNIGYSPTRWRTTLALADGHPQIFYTLGLHPGNAGEWSEDLFTELTEIVARTSPVAIGEIGLDYYWNSDNMAIQRASFERQLELAHGRNLPVVIHQRIAAADVAAILRDVPSNLRVILHSFDGDEALFDLAEERGWTVGVGGLMTRRQAESLRARLRSFPFSQVVLETDSPYLTPSGVKARRNTPSMIPLIAERLASLINCPVDQIATITTQNAERIFGLNVTARKP